MVDRIISGGQTGVDRAALDAAIALGVDHGGWCPNGRRAEDGVIPECYQLSETASFQYPDRTKQNVIDSEGTLILYRDRLSGGTRLTYYLAGQIGRPVLLVDLENDPDPELVQTWIRELSIEVLNVAGPRESSSPGITAMAEVFLREVLEIVEGIS